MPVTSSLDNFTHPHGTCLHRCPDTSRHVPGTNLSSVPIPNVQSPCCLPWMVPLAPQTQHGQNRAQHHCPLLLVLSPHPHLSQDALPCGKRNPLYSWWECELVHPPWRTVWRFLKKLKIELPYDPAIPLLGIYLEKTVI